MPFHPQGTEGWRRERLGRTTASRIADIIARTKNGWGASRANYAGQLIAERLTGEPLDFYKSAAMQWGTDKEPEAKRAYEFYTGNDVAAATFVQHPSIAEAGASPDGYIGEHGLVECKCPNTSTHIATLLSRSIDGRYLSQMQWQMACTNRLWCDFVSYDPRMPEAMRLFVKRVARDDVLIAELEKEVIIFLSEIRDQTFALNALYGEATTEADPINDFREMALA